ncbi:MAG TPA: hypothetical protein VL282_07895 [Tepidisphaeraceae bacterium]|nr:hypothetical protein [Tepidisphaeraceae bacterium]
MSDANLPVPADTRPAGLPSHNADARWKFIRDVAVFELKLAINNVHNFLQIPVSFAIAVFDLLFTAKEKPEGSRFYKFVEWGRTIDDHIDIYSVVEHRERSMNRDFTVDALVGKLEGVIVKEYEKGGTAATIKAAVDKAIDQMQSRGGPVGDKTDEALKRAGDKMKETMNNVRANNGENTGGPSKP